MNDKFKNEVIEKWGGTRAYAEFSKKTNDYSSADFDKLGAGLDSVLSEFASIMQVGSAADSPQSQSLVNKLQSFISANCYTCTDEILSSLGQMYVTDERMRQNINRHADGTAEFIGEAINARLIKE
ncbi:MAG: TipAS antibiotic-recognition domain-containing protein [Clostridia bacterium]|nr:TipAS antibiotic-recognition domain-containing protein [Clostridia bacterium]